MVKRLQWQRFILVLVFSIIQTSHAFVTETTFMIGHKKYVERLEQPWFRVPHRDHQKVDAANVDSSSFGKHSLPDDDVFIAPDWAPYEEKYLPCLDRKCVCPYFNGTTSGNDCVLKDGRLLNRAKRQEIRTLDDVTRHQFEDTVNWMKIIGLYNRIARVHKYSGVHSGPAFTLWHREFLKRFELVIRRFLPNTNMGIPYWDSTLDSELPNPQDSIIFTDIFLGETDENGFVISGPYANWTTMEGRPRILRLIGENPAGELLSNGRVDWIVNNPDLNMVLGCTMPLTTCSIIDRLDARMLEYSHDYVHFYIGGDMGSSVSSSNDVIFLYLHSMIDLIYEAWRQKMQSRTQRERDYPPNDPNCFPFWHEIDSIMPMLHPMTNREALSNGYTDEMYEFAPRPTCTKTDPDCHSKYLFCYISKKEDPRCMSKVRIGGNCRGFEGTEICYMSKCVQGLCQENNNEKAKLKKPEDTEIDGLLM